MVNLLNDKISQDAYQGDIAGYYASFGTTNYGVSMPISGYNEKFTLWSDKILELVTSAKFTQEDFDRLLDNLKRSIRNRDKDRPTSVAGNTFNNFMLSYSFANEDYLAELDKITLADIHEWRDNFFSQTRIMTLVYGNVRKDKAEELAGKLQLFNSQPLNDLVYRDKFIDLGGQGRFIAERPNQ